MGNTKKLSRNILGALCIISGASLWGIIGLFSRELNELGFDAMKLVCVRMIGSAALLSLFYLFVDRSAFKIRLSDLWLFFGTGIVSQVLYNWCYFHTIRISSLSIAAALLYTAPAFGILFATICFREKLTRVKLIALTATTIGCLLVTGAIGTGSKLGTVTIFCGLGAGFGFALYGVFGKLALKKGYNVIQITLWTNICGGAFSMALVNQIGLFRQLTHFKVTGTVLSLIVFATILPQVLYTTGLRTMDNGKAGLLGSVELVVATLISRFVFKEPITLMQLLGMCLVVCAVIVAALEPTSFKNRTNVHFLPGRRKRIEEAREREKAGRTQ